MSAEPKRHEMQPRYTVAEWGEWEGQWELIEGQAWAMTPAPRRSHQRITFALAREMEDALDGCGECEVCLSINYKLAAETVLQPDIAVVCGVKEDFVYLEDRPSLVVEVLSPSTAFKDMNLKTVLYAAQGVPYYLLVNPDEEWVRVLQLRDGKYQQVMQGHDESYRFELDGCAMELEFGGIWGR